MNEVAPKNAYEGLGNPPEDKALWHFTIKQIMLIEGQLGDGTMQNSMFDGLLALIPLGKICSAKLSEMSKKFEEMRRALMQRSYALGLDMADMMKVNAGCIAKIDGLLANLKPPEKHSKRIDALNEDKAQFVQYQNDIEALDAIRLNSENLDELSFVQRRFDTLRTTFEEYLAGFRNRPSTAAAFNTETLEAGIGEFESLKGHRVANEPVEEPSIFDRTHARDSKDDTGDEELQEPEAA